MLLVCRFQRASRPPVRLSRIFGPELGAALVAYVSTLPRTSEGGPAPGRLVRGNAKAKRRIENGRTGRAPAGPTERASVRRRSGPKIQDRLSVSLRFRVI